MAGFGQGFCRLTRLLTQFTHHHHRFFGVFFELGKPLFQFRQGDMNGIHDMPAIELFFLSNIDDHRISAINQRHCLRRSYRLAAGTIMIKNDRRQRYQPHARKHQVVAKKLNKLCHFCFSLSGILVA